VIKNLKSLKSNAIDLHFGPQIPITNITKVDVPNSVCGVKQTPIFGCYMVGCDLNTNTKKIRVKKDWSACPKFVNHSKHNGQHHLGELYDHLIAQRILH
jgi:hypothetical protein